MRRPGQSALALALAGLVASVAGCALPDGEWFGAVPTPDPTHFRWCNSGEPEYIDPLLASSTTDLKVVYALFDGLTSYGPDGRPMPSLAERWESSADQRRFTFHLRRDARWSDGAPLTSADFVYSIARLLHPLTASRNVEAGWKVRHGRAYTDGTAKLLLADAPPLRAGEVVEVLPDGDAPPPDSNLRRARTPLALRAAPDDNTAAVWGRVPAGGNVTIIELGGADRRFAYLHHAAGADGVYGWAPLAALDAPHDAHRYQVRELLDAVAARALPVDRRRTATALGRELLMLPELLGVSAPDPYTLVLETEGPTPTLLDLTAQKALRPVPRQAVSRHPRRWTFPEHIVTSGPFQLTHWRQRDRFELVRSTTFWGRSEVRLERVTIYSLGDQSASASLYHQGGCDATVANNVPAAWLPALAGETGGTRRRDYTRAPFLGIYYYIVNTERLPNAHLRRALAHALDRSELPALLKGGQLPSVQLTPGTPAAALTAADRALCGLAEDSPLHALVVEAGLCYVPAPGPAFDPLRAQEELALARAELGEKFPTRIGVKFNTGVEYHKHIAEWAQEQWRNHLGLAVDLEAQEWKTYLKATVAGEYDVGRFGNIGNFPDPEEFLSSFRCASPDNRTRYCDPEFERLLDEAELEPDRRRRLALVARADARLLDAAPLIPLFVYTQHHLIRPYVRGLDVNLVDQQDLRRVSIDPAWREAAP